MITTEDLWLMPRVGAPVASPDGRMAVFAVSQPAYGNGKGSSDLWLVASDGNSPPRQLTFDRGGESGMAWSPDGKRLAFVAKRGDNTAEQVYVLDLAGGEALSHRHHHRRAQSALFPRPQLLFISNVPPQSHDEESRRRLVTEQEERKHSALVYTGFPIRSWDRWRDTSQVRVFVQDLARDADGSIRPARDLLAGSQLVQLPGFGGSGGMGREEMPALWAPDGGSIVFAASRNRDRSAWSYTHTDLWRVPVSGGEPQRLTGPDSADPDDGYSFLAFSDNGARLFAMVHPRTGMVYNAPAIEVFDWPSMTVVDRIQAPDAVPSAVSSSPAAATGSGSPSASMARNTSGRRPRTRTGQRVRASRCRWFLGLSGGGGEPAPVAGPARQCDHAAGSGPHRGRPEPLPAPVRLHHRQGGAAGPGAAGALRDRARRIPHPQHAGAPAGL